MCHDTKAMTTETNEVNNMQGVARFWWCGERQKRLGLEQQEEGVKRRRHSVNLLLLRIQCDVMKLCLTRNP